MTLYGNEHEPMEPLPESQKSILADIVRLREKWGQQPPTERNYEMGQKIFELYAIAVKDASPTIRAQLNSAMVKSKINFRFKGKELNVLTGHKPKK